MTASRKIPADSCPFANVIAKKNKIEEGLFKDMCDTDKIGAVPFIVEARHKACKCDVPARCFLASAPGVADGTNGPNLIDPLPSSSNTFHASNNC